MNRYRLFHITEFQYDGLVSESYNEVRLRPMQDEFALDSFNQTWGFG